MILKCFRCSMLLLCFAASAARAEAPCAFNDNALSEARYKENPAIAHYAWNAETKEAKGITQSGALFSAKHWACNHYGTHAFMFVGPYDFYDTEGIARGVVELTGLTLKADEIDRVKKALENKSFQLSEGMKTIYVDTQEYSEFYVSYGVVSEMQIFEIKLYKD